MEISAIGDTRPIMQSNRFSPCHSQMLTLVRSLHGAVLSGGGTRAGHGKHAAGGGRLRGCFQVRCAANRSGGGGTGRAGSRTCPTKAARSAGRDAENAGTRAPAGAVSGASDGAGLQTAAEPRTPGDGRRTGGGGGGAGFQYRCPPARGRERSARPKDGLGDSAGGGAARRTRDCSRVGGDAARCRAGETAEWEPDRKGARQGESLSQTGEARGGRGRQDTPQEGLKVRAGCGLAGCGNRFIRGQRFFLEASDGQDWVTLLSRIRA